MAETYDFSGWATRFGLKCADGRTIDRGAFDDDNQKTVPLVWSHQHDNPDNVLGQAKLETRPEGVYAYCSFNNSPRAQSAREAVQHGDINSLSIYANKLKHRGSNVMHGVIKEVSLVLAGANPGALIDFPILAHGEEDPDEAIFYNDTVLDNGDPLMHAEYLPLMPMPMPEVLVHAEGGTTMPGTERTVRDVFNELTDEQKNVVYYIIGEMLENVGGGDADMKHNVFEGDNALNSLAHMDFGEIIADAKKNGSLKAAYENYISEHDTLAHAVYNSDGTQQTYGIADINTLFPEYRNLNNPPEFIKRDQEWVGSVMNGVHHTPFSRIKSQFANITMDEARAKGYVKGNKKIEEVFSLLRRTTDPQTIYKKQKLDRDDIIDITDFNVVDWLKKEMRMMLDEEIARAILIGDGRLSTDDDKISDAHIRPIWGDDELYSIKANVTAGTDDAATAKNLIRTAIKARKDYKGSGNLVLFTTEDWLTEMLLLEDGIGHTLYADEAALARKLRVSKIVTVPVMENQAHGNEKLVGIMVDLRDYNVGADKGGAVAMFDDFDIDYNQQKYLIETRISGALIKPYSAIVLTVNGKTTTYTAVTPAEGDNPSTKGWYEKNGTLYVPSTDTEVNEAKTYYSKTVA